MKKLLLALLVVGSVAYADDCAQNAQKAVDKLHQHNLTTVQFNYSKDKADVAKMCEADIKAIDGNIKVVSKIVDGSGKFKMSKPTS